MQHFAMHPHCKTDEIHCEWNGENRSARNISDVVVLFDMVINVSLAGLDEDGIVGFKVVLLEHCLAVADLQIKKPVAFCERKVKVLQENAHGLPMWTSSPVVFCSVMLQADGWTSEGALEQVRKV